MAERLGGQGEVPVPSVGKFEAYADVASSDLEVPSPAIVSEYEQPHQERQGQQIQPQHLDCSLDAIYYELEDQMTVVSASTNHSQLEKEESSTQQHRQLERVQQGQQHETLERKPRQLLRPPHLRPEAVYYEVEEEGSETTGSDSDRTGAAAAQQACIPGPYDGSSEKTQSQGTFGSSASVGGLPSHHVHHHRNKQSSRFFRQTSSVGGMNRVPGQHRQIWTTWYDNCIIIRPKFLRGPLFHQRVRMLALAAVVVLAVVSPKAVYTGQTKIRVAMIGNSMMYYNDFPRFLQALSDKIIDQDSCLHGDATLQSILITGSGMFKVWQTGVAQIQNATVQLYGEGEEEENEEDKEHQNRDEDNNKRRPTDDFTRLYDYGACTVPQLLFGYDPALDQLMNDWSFDDAYRDYGDDHFDDDDYYVIDKRDVYNYEFDNFMDGTNPCLMDPNYYDYRNYLFYGAGVRKGSDDDDAVNDDYDDYVNNNPYYNVAEQQQMQYRYPSHVKSPHWDFILLNDNTRSPAQFNMRQMGLNILEHKYLLWFQQTRARPVFIFTYAYDTPYRDMGAKATNDDNLLDEDNNRPLSDIPYFTSLTYEGYRQYASLLSERLPPEQQPLIAPVGLAFLTIWEENFNFWDNKLFHVDRIHASPSGTYLQGLVVHHTLLGRLPHKATAIYSLESLFNDARRMQPEKHRSLPLPTRDDAAYLYEIAYRVCVQGHVPKSFIRFQHGEASYYIPNDKPYYNDDLYRRS